ncbi:MAG: AzlC family ABC transporter permease [Negativicutes bacterium]|nr:AzlC family ABC transporter permease [Negativicutes bacterium]
MTGGKAVLAYRSPEEFWEGCRDCLPLMAGGIPFGLTCGMMSVAAGFHLPEVVLMSLVVFSGTSQFVMIMMLQSGNAVLGMVMFNVLLVNLHNLLLMASLAPHLLRLPAPLRHLLCFGISDGTYAITMNRIQQRGYSADYQLGNSAVQFFFWLAANVAGALVGEHISNPLSWGLDFSITAVFIAILIPKLLDRTTMAVSVVAAVTAVAGSVCLGGKWYILLACVAGTLTGILLEGRGRDAG